MSLFVSPASAQLNEIDEFTNIDYGDIELSSYAQEASLSQGALNGDILAFKAEVFSVPQYGDKCVIETIWERWSDGALIEAGVMNSAPFSCDGGESFSQKDQAEFVACDSAGYDPVTHATSSGPPCDDDGGGGNSGPGSSTGGGVFGNGGGFGSGGGEFGSPIGVAGIFAHLGDGSTDGGSDDPDSDGDDGFCDSEGCTVEGTLDTTPGHDYRTTNVVCEDASLLSLADLQATIGWFTIPRQFAYLVDARTLDPGDETLVTHPVWGFPGGWVTTRLDPNGLSGTNTVVADRHVLAGTVTRTLIVTPSGQLAIATVGVGISTTVLVAPSPSGIIIVIPLGESIDAVNEPLGRNVFNALDNIAAIRLRSQFPGC